MNGIGGSTIAEAKRQLTYGEFVTWIKYRRKRGSLNVGMRIERGFALLATLYANAHVKNGKYTILDFMPHADEPEVTLEEAMKSWG